MIAVILLIALATSGPPSQAEDRPLPALSLEGLPAAVRQDLEGAHEAAAARPDDAAAVGRLAMLLHAYEQHSLAAAAYERAHALDRGRVQWTYLRAVVLAELGEHARAAALFRAALALEPTSLPARVRLAASLFQAGALEDSRAEYLGLLRTFPDLPAAHFGLGRIAVAAGEPDAAAGHFDRAVAASPQFGRAHYALALAHRDAGRLEEAERHMRAYRAIGSGEPVLPDRWLDEVLALRSTARDLIAEGAKLGADGRIAESIAAHLKALETDPAASQAHVNLISLYGRAGRVQEAEEHYRKALSLGSNLAGAHYNYGVLLASTRRRPEALTAFQQTLAIDPFHAAAHNNVAGLLAEQQRFAEAADHFRQALAAEPQHRAARFGLARVLLSLGHPEDAIGHLERLLTPDGAETPGYKYVLAHAWLAKGDSGQARAYAEDAHRSALRHGQMDLARRIEQDLQRMPK